MFKFIKNKINKVYNQFTTKLSSIFTNNKLDEKFLTELRILLLSADTGTKITNKIIKNLKEKIGNKTINNMQEAKKKLAELLVESLNITKEQNTNNKDSIIMLVGINGTGKTTFAAKLANELKNKNKKVLLVAADTFRAAAVEQLKDWSKKINVEIFAPQSESTYPASIIFDAVTKFKNENYDHIIIDTAGRLQTKTNLMRELEKINRVIKKVLPNKKITSLLTIDSMLGQNSLDQARIFENSINLDGIILTKLDGTGKGGIVFSITEELKLPIKYITFGEKIEDIEKFNAKKFVTDLLNN